jgi:hypothetical protein
MKKIRNALGILSSEVATGNLVWVDQVNGIDSLARRGRFTIPFKTLTAAKNAAKPGDTIIVLPGTYNEKNLLKHGVNWHFMSGAAVIYTGSEAGAIFDASSYGTGGGAWSRVTGFGYFENQGTDDSSSYVVHTSLGTSNLHIQATAMVAVKNAIRIAHTAGNLEIEVND